MSGTLREGDRLPSENQMCRSFQASRPVVRQALLRLQADGLVVSRQGSGTFVQRRPPEGLTRFTAASTVADMLRCLELRMAVESQAAALAALRRTPAQLHDLQHALEDIEKQMGTGELAVAADFGFHQAVAKASGNALFEQVLQGLHDTIERGMTVALSITREGSPERARRVHDEHHTIYRAIAQRDMQGADLAMRYHLERLRQRVTDSQRDR
ncbi:transcriptional regulator, GntR family [Faunimonas pinastri]|uniref:Transcriptional regulator, GntR family n=1 Tax=Faunimonas pinastri TaxID=1855383 RepID=A0A1H9LK24_9HYPH|nr:transcriptional regulator, GntR family [Faunimonas pinastri]